MRFSIPQSGAFDREQVLSHKLIFSFSSESAAVAAMNEQHKIIAPSGAGMEKRGNQIAVTIVPNHGEMPPESYDHSPATVKGIAEYMVSQKGQLKMAMSEIFDQGSGLTRSDVHKIVHAEHKQSPDVNVIRLEPKRSVEEVRGLRQDKSLKLAA